MPDRIQLRRTAGWRLPPGARSVARPHPWSNPFRIGYVAIEIAVGCYSPTNTRWEDRTTLRAPFPLAQHPYRLIDSRDLAVNMFTGWGERRHALTPDGTSVPYPDAARAWLHGLDLACYCPLDEPCHVDVLLRWANP